MSALLPAHSAWEWCGRGATSGPCAANGSAFVIKLPSSCIRANLMERGREIMSRIWLRTLGVEPRVPGSTCGHNGAVMHRCGAYQVERVM